MTCSSFSTWSSCWADAEARTRRNRVAIGRWFSGKPLQDRGFLLHMFISGNNCLTQILFLLVSRTSRPPEGHSHEGVMAVGRDAAPASVTPHTSRPRAALGKPPRGKKTAGSVRLAVNAKAGDAAWRAELARRIR